MRRCRVMSAVNGVDVFVSRFLFLVMLVGVLVSGCSLSDDPEEAATSDGPAPSATTVDGATTSTLSTTVIVAAPSTTSIVPATTTTTQPPATTTTTYYASTPSLYPPDPLASGGASGSGCSPGAGPLPAGVWFGYVSTGNPTTLQFDLACWYFGDVAWDIAAARGDTADNDYYVVNDNPTLRTVPVSVGAVVHHINETSTAHDPIAYPEWLLEPPGYLACPFDFCPLWLYVNGGEVTEIVEQYVP